MPTVVSRPEIFSSIKTWVSYWNAWERAVDQSATFSTKDTPAREPCRECLTTIGGIQPFGQPSEAELTMVNRGVGIPAATSFCFVSTLSNAIRLASGPQPV